MKPSTPYIAAAGLFVILTLYWLLRVPYEEVKISATGQAAQYFGAHAVVADNATVRAFTHAVRFSRKEPEVVDLSTPPPFTFKLGDKEYFLWLDEERGTGFLMRAANTHSLYALTSYSAKELKEALSGLELHN